MAMKINNEFSIGQKVYLVADAEQLERMVVYIVVTPIGLLYGVSVNGDTDDYYSLELSDTKQII